MLAGGGPKAQGEILRPHLRPIIAQALTSGCAGLEESVLHFALVLVNSLSPGWVETARPYGCAVITGETTH
jgi:hypothetical protein